MKYFTIKSTSDEGVYYFCKRNKDVLGNQRIWIKECQYNSDPEYYKNLGIFYTSQARAIASFKSLLKSMPEYGYDKLELIEL